MSTSPPFALGSLPISDLGLACTAPGASSLMVMEATAASRAEVDTSRPFQSVRQAVEVFGERYNGSGSSRASSESSVKLSAPPMTLELDCLKKLEEELAVAKGELVELRQRQAQMEVAVSSLSVQFSKGMAVFSGLSKGKELAVVGAPAAIGEEEYNGHGRVRSDRWDESRAEEWMAASLEYLPSLSEALAIKMIEDDLGDRKEKKAKNSKNKADMKKHKKQKSGISLLGGMFFSKKAKSK